MLYVIRAWLREAALVRSSRRKRGGTAPRVREWAQQRRERVERWAADRVTDAFADAGIDD